MRRLLIAMVVLAGCGREPDPPPPPPAPIQPPKPSPLGKTTAAPLDRIAFVREDGIWTANAGGGDLQRIVPPTIPRASEPAWGPDRRWLAFTAGPDPEFNLFARNVFIARHDGSDLIQVTPGPRAGPPPDDAPKGIVRGRAILASDIARRPLARLRVTAAGQRRAEATDPEGNFQTYLPVGGGWVKISGEVDGRPVVAWRFAFAGEGRITELKDVAVSFAGDDVAAAPAWSSDGRQLIYVLRHAPLERRGGAPRASLRRIKTDGSGDETLATFAESTVIAGPVVRGDSAWCKMSDGTLLRFDLKNKAVAESRPSGISAPDALSVSPDGLTLATLMLDAAGARSIVLIRKEGSETISLKPGEPAIHALDFSPDGTKLVLDRHGPDGKSSIWILTLASRQFAPLTDPGSDPVWHGR
ncbi:MAG: PD40 domain-containing protein [Planctomycetes bacterium]|nr:PD40 domain-containing protein [Planctomycetota bacterium]